MKNYVPQAAALLTVVLLGLGLSSAQKRHAGDESLGSRKYSDYETPQFCGTACHTDIYRQWQKAMMSQAYTHHWDEIEYFELAVPHSQKDPSMAAAQAGCNGCHAPLAFLAGDVPPPRPEKGSRANESVSCDFCHTVTGFSGDTPFNYNWISEPGKTKYGPRGAGDSPEHKLKKSDFLGQAEFCATCHNEKSPFNVWVKSTHLEWRDGPYSKEGVSCHNCHMTYAPGKSAAMGETYSDVRQHLFHGAHDPGKIAGTIEIRLYSDVLEAEPGETVRIQAVLFNQKTGHKFPTGSVEDRIVWLHVEAVDSAGKVHHLPVDKKGFAGEEYTIGADVLAYQDMGVPLDLPDFAGVQRDGIPAGDRIFRMPYFDPQGRMTIQQWNTKSLGPDYRFGPRETKIETFTFHLPDDTPAGEMTITAVLNYQKLVKPVADFLHVPADESEIIEVNRQKTSLKVLD